MKTMNNKPYPLYEIPDVCTLRELVDNGREKGESVTAFYRGRHNDQPITFGDCSRIVERLGTYLLSLGLHSDHIAIIGENSTEWVLSFLAVTNSGNTAVPLDRGLPYEDLAELVLHCDCRAIIYSEKSRRTIEFLQGLGKPYIDIMYMPLSEFDAYVAAGARLLDEGNSQFKDVGETIGRDTLASIVYTSGTSGRMKGVMLSHGNLASDTVGACRNAEAENAQLLLPLHHTFAWSSQMLAAFIYIKDLHISGNLKHILRDFQRNCPQNVAAVPMMVDMLYKGVWDTAKRSGSDRRLKRGIRLSRFLMKFGIDRRRSLFREVHENFGGRLALIICGGAALDPETEKGLYDLGIQVLNGYGITECSPIVSVNRNHHYKFGSVGLPLPCNRIKIDDPDENGIGEIMVAGSNVMLGYYKDPEATKEAFAGEWFRTGDYGRIDKDGFLFITGRKKNLIILANGENVMPEELEMKLGRLEYVVDVVCYEENGSITAEFYLDEEHFSDARSRLEEDIGIFNRTMPMQKNISGVKIRDIPFEKTTTMKIKRYLLKQG
jgi:long-chain acyl-CoA synthetase